MWRAYPGLAKRAGSHRGPYNRGQEGPSETEEGEAIKEGVVGFRGQELGMWAASKSRERPGSLQKE